MTSRAVPICVIASVAVTPVSCIFDYQFQVHYLLTLYKVNIYVQRDPSVSPGPACPNPIAVFNVICALYSEPIPSSACTNVGQYIGPEDTNGDAFRVAIRGSNRTSFLLLRDGVFLSIY